MSERKIDHVDVAAKAIAAAGTALATGQHPTAAAAIGAMTAAASSPMVSPVIAGGIDRVLDKVRGWWSTRRENRVDRVIQATIEEAGPSAGELARSLEEATEEPFVRDNLIGTIRAAVDAVEDAAIPALGRLSAEYLLRQQHPDRFFRGTARMLSEMSGEELATMRALLGGVAAEIAAKKEAKSGSAAKLTGTSALFLQCKLTGGRELSIGTPGAVFGRISCPSDFVHMVRLLDQANIVDTRQAHIGGDVLHVSTSEPILSRLVHILGVE